MQAYKNENTGNWQKVKSFDIAGLSNDKTNGQCCEGLESSQGSARANISGGDYSETLNNLLTSLNEMIS